MTRVSPLFTVVITTYQRPLLLAEAIESVLAQDFDDFELLIIDDASQDNTQAVAQAFVGPKVRYFRQSTNQGIGAARNVGIDQAGGELIVFLDDDDALLPDYLRQIYQVWQTVLPTVKFFLPSHTVIRLSSTEKTSEKTFITHMDYGFKEPTVLTGHQYWQNPFGSGSGLVVRAEALREIGGFSTERSLPEDSDLMLRLTIHGDMMVVPHARFAATTAADSGTQITKSNLWLGQARERLITRHDARLRELYPATLARYYTSAARAYYAVKDRAGGRRCMVQAIQVAPFAYRPWRLWLLMELSPILPHPIRHRLFANYRHGYPAT